MRGEGGRGNGEREGRCFGAPRPVPRLASLQVSLSNLTTLSSLSPFQASFNPPGLTIAVKRDRAAEPFLTKGSPFVVNILADGREKALVKAMTRPFGPGEDRFAGIEGVTASEAAGGAPILPDIASYLECIVADRMDAGDHYIVYATVCGGQVVDPGADSAVHQRKSGASY